MPQNYNRNNNGGGGKVVSIATSNKGRRIFRGRGGPNDGHNIPPPSSSTKRRMKPDTNKYYEHDNPPLLLTDLVVPTKHDSEISRKQDLLSPVRHQQQQEDDSTTIIKENEPNTNMEQVLNNPIISEKPASSIDSDNNNNNNNNNNNDNDNCESSITEIPSRLPDDKRTTEIKHLQKRILNVQESIKLSKLALCNPQNWENNCLNAVHNCVGEWRAIVSFYHVSESTTKKNDDDDDDNHETDDISIHTTTTTTTTTTSLQIFGLVQMAMQSGPLTGCKPGYLKRCGSDVAKIVHRFLLRTVAGDSITELKFSEKQSHAIAKWILNAEKAIANDKPPSKSSLKLQNGKNKKVTLKDKKKQPKGKK